MIGLTAQPAIKDIPNARATLNMRPNYYWTAQKRCCAKYRLRAEVWEEGIPIP
ncbi:hypothetical protein GGR62_004227 [Xanthomonas campestris]|nr:hypothetical protein [Xanthomonas sp. 3075]